MKRFYDLDLLESQIFGDTEPEDGEPAEGWDPSEDGEPAEGWDLSEDGQEPEEVRELPPEDLMITLTLEDGSEVCCRAAGIFIENGKEYIALESGDEEIRIMALSQGEDDSIMVLPVEDDEERESAFRAFLEIVGTERGENDDGDQNREED